MNRFRFIFYALSLITLGCLLYYFCLSPGQAKLIVKTSLPEKKWETDIPYTYIGDTIYVTISIKNAGKGLLKGIAPVGYLDSDVVMSHYVHVDISCPELGMKYISCQEDNLANPFHLNEDFLWKPPPPIQPGETLRLAELRIDLPPLEELDSPFWKEVRRYVGEHQRVLCTLDLTFYPRNSTIRSLRTSLSFYLCNRGMRIPTYGPVALSKDEMEAKGKEEFELLDKWLRETPEVLLPIRKAGRRHLTRKGYESLFQIPSEIRTPKGLRNELTLLNTYITRKPMWPNAPTTVEGWWELEAKFLPSTMRDEITYRRMVLELFLAETPEKYAEKQSLLSEWLKTLPSVQAEVMVHYGKIQSLEFGIEIYEKKKINEQ